MQKNVVRNFVVMRVERAYGPNGWEVVRTPYGEVFEGFGGFDKAVAWAATEALLGRVVEVWHVDEALKPLWCVAVLSWWSMRDGCTTVTHDTDYLDTTKPSA
jgi:hypothetical protein